MNFSTGGQSASVGVTSLPAGLLEQLEADPAGNAMGVRFETVTAAGEVAFSQRIEDWQLDARGRVGLVSLGVLIDIAAGSGAYLHRPDNRYVVSRLAVSLVPWIGVDDDSVRALADAVAIDDVTGTALNHARLESGGRPLGTVQCRSVQAARPPMSPDELAAINAEADGLVPDGPLWRVLGLTGVDDSGGPERFAVGWQVPGWSLNALGTVQGGSLLSATAGAVDLVAAELCPDQDYAVTDLSIELMRSPAATEQPHRFTTAVIRRGARLVVLVTELHDVSGRIFAHSTATLLLRPVSPAPGR